MYITILLPSLAESISTYFTNTMNTCTNFIHPPLKPRANILSKDMVCNLAKITIVWSTQKIFLHIQPPRKGLQLSNCHKQKDRIFIINYSHTNLKKKLHICANKVGPYSHDQPLQTMNLHGASKCTRITNYKSHDCNGADDLSILNPYNPPSHNCKWVSTISKLGREGS
jgi:hypothetical protein